MAIPLEQQNIIKILGIENLPDEKKVEMVEKISTLVQKRLLLRLVESVPADKQTELAALLEKSDQDTLNAFLQTNAPQFPEWIVEEVTKVKQELTDLKNP